MGTEAIVELDTRVFRLEAVKKAAYRFGGRCFARFELVGPTTVRVTLNPRLPEEVERLVGEFRNEVLDQELRETVAAETEAVRNLILAQAFSKTALLDPIGDLG